MEKNDLKQIKEIVDSVVGTAVEASEKRLTRSFAKTLDRKLDEKLETHLASVHEDIEDLRTELKGDIKKVDDRVLGVESRFGAIDNRIDNESAARGNLESRVRKALPKLPAAPQIV